MPPSHPRAQGWPSRHAPRPPGRDLAGGRGGRDLPANPESARWRSDLHCARAAARVVPQHTLRERDRGPGGRPIGIIDEAVDPNGRPRFNIECGLIEELEICASLHVGVHQIVLCDRCANASGRTVSEYAWLDGSSPADSLRRGRPTRGEADCDRHPKELSFCPCLELLVHLNLPSSTPVWCTCHQIASWRGRMCARAHPSVATES